MVQPMSASGLEILNMDMESRFGKMAPNTKEIGDLIKLAAKENSGMLMEMFLKVNG